MSADQQTWSKSYDGVTQFNIFMRVEDTSRTLLGNVRLGWQGHLMHSLLGKIKVIDVRCSLSGYIRLESLVHYREIINKYITHEEMASISVILNSVFSPWLF